MLASLLSSYVALHLLPWRHNKAVVANTRWVVRLLTLANINIANAP